MVDGLEKSKAQNRARQHVEKSDTNNQKGKNAHTNTNKTQKVNGNTAVPLRKESGNKTPLKSVTRATPSRSQKGRTASKTPKKTPKKSNKEKSPISEEKNISPSNYNSGQSAQEAKLNAMLLKDPNDYSTEDRALLDEIKKNSVKAQN